MGVNVTALFAVLKFVIPQDLIQVRVAPSASPNDSKTSLVPAYVPYSSELPSRVDNHTPDNWSGYNDSYSGSNGVVVTSSFSGNSNSVTDILDATNTFDNILNGAGSVRFDLNPRDCINNSHYQVTGRQGYIIVTFAPDPNPEKSFPFLACYIDLEVPQGAVAYLQTIDYDLDGAGFRVTLLDGDKKVLYDDSWGTFPKEFVTFSSILSFRVEMLSVRHPLKLHLNFTAVPEAARSQMYATFTSPTTGHLQVSEWRRNGKYPPYIDTGILLAPPTDHAVIVNIHGIESVNCNLLVTHHDLLFFYTANDTIVQNPCTLNKNGFTDPFISHGNTYVQYKSYRLYSKSYFRIMFSFHHVSALPAQLSENTWNCSGVHWPDMRQHFPCNYRSECVGGEDEAECWPVSDTCSPGTYQVDGRCFSIVRLECEEQSWNTASRGCQQRGGQLPSISTRKLWDFVTDLFARLNDLFWIFVGAKLAPPSASPMYRSSWIWSDGTIAHFIKIMFSGQNGNLFDACTTLGFPIAFWQSTPLVLNPESCEQMLIVCSILCEVSGISRLNSRAEQPEIPSSKSTSIPEKAAYIWCPGNHFTHVFLACDEFSSCWSKKDDATLSCSVPTMPLPPLFKCVNVQRSVPYTLVCDHRDDCIDGSDEDFCYFPPCDVTSPFLCSGRRCVQQWQRCNGQMDCDDGADESRCQTTSSFLKNTLDLPLPLKIDLDSKGSIIFSPYTGLEYNSSRFACPDSHFTCASLEQVCLPIYFRCNGANDCPGHEDEAACDSYRCPGFYRCRASQVCVHESNLCDKVYHCPQRDDEILCHEMCPENCVCHGWAFICSRFFLAGNYVNLRYLDFRGTLMTLADLENNTFLVHLSLVGCNLTKLHEVNLPNLRILDLSHNKLTLVNNEHFAGLTNLEYLKLSFNPLSVLSFRDSSQTSSLKVLDMSDVRVPEVDFEIFAFFSSLTTFNLSGSQIMRVTGQGFRPMDSMQILDLRHCPITYFPRGVFRALTKVKTIFSDNYKLCCPATLPVGFNVLSCHAPSDEVSSCDDLLRSNLYRVGIALFSSLAILGNVGSLMYRLIFHKTPGDVGYDVFVTNLCVADLLMGVYLLIIAVSDNRYRGAYLSEDVNWRHSSLCTVAGVTCLLSSEVSVFIIFFITCDRFVVLRFPFSQVHFGKRSAQVACMLAWVTGLALAVVPVLPMTSHWEFYRQTSICIPLPTSRVYFPGFPYSFGVIIVLNFIFFLLIFIGQVCVYWSIRSNAISSANSSKTVKDFKIAQRLITVVMSDFLCWFPIGLTGILASHDFPISGEVSVAMAIFVLPLNAALNPFLYTINIYLGRRRRKKEDLRRKQIIAQLKQANGYTGAKNIKVTMTNNDALNPTKTLALVKIVTPEDLRNVVHVTR